MPVVVLKTNFIPQQVDVVVPLTNVVGQVVFQTNTTTINVPQVTQITNSQPAYTLTPNSTAQSAANIVGTVANAAIPGAGSLISMGILAALGIWGHLRSYKLSNTVATTTATNQATTQEIETLLEFIGALPNGSTYVSTVTSFLQAHQAEAGVINQVVTLLQNDVSNPDAKVAAQEIINTINGLTTATAPVPAAAVPLKIGPVSLT